MAWYNPRNILAHLRRKRAPIVVDGKINPELLEIAQWGHWLQSRVLHIPDRYGLLSSGPPLLQAFQARKVGEIVTEAVGRTISASLVELMVFETGWWLPLATASVCLLFTVSIYVEEVFFNPMRAPDYNWSSLNERMGVAHEPV